MLINSINQQDVSLVPPQNFNKCSCGCGGTVQINPKSKKIPKFIQGHNSVKDPVKMLSVHKEYQEALVNPPICACGCGEKIKIKNHHKKTGVPNFLERHWHKKNAFNVIKHREAYEAASKGLILCACGCGEKLVAKAYSRKYGIPKTIKGHQSVKYPIDFLKRKETYKEALLNPPLCACGCGEKIKVKPHHRQHGIPKVIYRHCSPETKYTLSKTLTGGTNSAKGKTWEERYGKEIADTRKEKQKQTKITWNKGKAQYEKEYKEALLNPPLCKCGCNKYIKLFDRYRSSGVPKYISGHNGKITNLGIKHSDARKKAQSLRMTGVKRKPHSEETKKKMREKRLTWVVPIQDTSIEIKLQEALYREGIPFKTHSAILGQPDIFIEPNICIFADGDYWHGNPMKYKADSSLMYKKILNRKMTAKEVWDKDAKISDELDKQGYIVLRFWEYSIRNEFKQCINVIKGVYRCQCQKI